MFIHPVFLVLIMTMITKKDASIFLLSSSQGVAGPWNGTVVGKVAHGDDREENKYKKVKPGKKCIFCSRLPHLRTTYGTVHIGYGLPRVPRVPRVPRFVI